MKLYENKNSPLLPTQKFNERLRRNIFVAAIILAISLLIGVVGYHSLAKLSWVDSLLNASMILGGMGPVDTLKTDGAKIFASGYAIFSGIAFLSVVGVVLAPILHRFMHRFHLRENDN